MNDIGEDNSGNFSILDIKINPILKLLKDEKLSPFSSHIRFELNVRFIAECSIILLLVSYEIGEKCSNNL